MSKRERIVTVVLSGVFICYLLLLAKILLFSRVSFSELLNGQRIVNRSINLIPFHSITGFVSGSTENESRFSFANVVGNIVLFIPLGIYLPALKKNKRVISNLFIVGIVSLCAEIIQGLLGIGTADIDDLILNCLGGWTGILTYKLLMAIFRDDNKARTALAVMSVVLGLPVIVYFMFFIKMRF